MINLLNTIDYTETYHNFGEWVTSYFSKIIIFFPKPVTAHFAKEEIAPTNLAKQSTTLMIEFGQKILEYYTGGHKFHDKVVLNWWVPYVCCTSLPKWIPLDPGDWSVTCKDYLYNRPSQINSTNPTPPRGLHLTSILYSLFILYSIDTLN